MSQKKVVYFGTRLRANRWANKNDREYRDVYLGTQTSQIQEIDHVPDVIIDDQWDITPKERNQALLTLDVLEILKRLHSEKDTTNA